MARGFAAKIVLLERTKKLARHFLLYECIVYFLLSKCIESNENSTCLFSVELSLIIDG